MPPDYLHESSDVGRTSWTSSEWLEALRATTPDDQRVSPIDPIGLMKWDGLDVTREAARAALWRGDPVDAVATELGVPADTIRQWQQDYDEHFDQLRRNTGL